MHFYQDTIFCASPENSTYMADETEGNVTKHFACIATNAYDITWIVNGSEMHGEDRTHQSIFRSTLHYEISVGESIEVFCRAKPFNRNLPSVDSETAVISVQGKSAMMYFHDLPYYIGGHAQNQYCKVVVCHCSGPKLVA